MILKDFKFENGKIGGIPDVIIFSEQKDGLHITHERKKIERWIGNFALRLIKVDTEYHNEYDSKIKYCFKVYTIRKGRVIENDIDFYIYDNESATNKNVAARLKDVTLERDKVSLEYFNYYVWYLINHERKLNFYHSVNNEMNVKKVRDYLSIFVQLIHGKENEFIESSFDYRNDSDFYKEKNICGNKDLFLYNYRMNENYKKIGYEDGDFYYIHLAALIQFMESERRFPEVLTSQIINIGLHKLNIIALPDDKNTQSIKSRCEITKILPNGNEEKTRISMNLTKLYANRLLELGFPNSEIEPEEEPEPIKEKDSEIEDDWTDEDWEYYEELIENGESDFSAKIEVYSRKEYRKRIEKE